MNTYARVVCGVWIKQQNQKGVSRRDQSMPSNHAKHSRHNIQCNWGTI